MSLNVIVGTRLDRKQVRALDKVRGRTGRAAALRELTMTAIEMRHEYRFVADINGLCGTCNQPDDSLIHLTFREIDSLARASIVTRDASRFDTEELHSDGTIEH